MLAAVRHTFLEAGFAATHETDVRAVMVGLSTRRIHFAEVQAVLEDAGLDGLVTVEMVEGKALISIDE